MRFESTGIGLNACFPCWEILPMKVTRKGMGVVLYGESIRTPIRFIGKASGQSEELKA
jgi:hypothetical protein